MIVGFLFNGAQFAKVSGKFTLSVFTEHGVPTSEIRQSGALDSIRRDDLAASGTANTFEAAKAAALFEAGARSPD